jgi:N-acetylneuraminate synthase
MSPIFVIAEAGVNHNGRKDLALELIDVAADSGADAIKFQTFCAEKVASKSAPKAAYQVKETSKEESQLSMLKKLELPFEWHPELKEYSEYKGIQFLSTAFDLESLAFLNNTLQLDKFKIPSGEITNGPLLLEYAKLKKPLILSTGMSTLGDVETALSVLAFGLVGGIQPSLKSFKEAYLSKEGQLALKQHVSLLHCTSLYPAPEKSVNLRAMETLKKAFGLPVGYSDHTQGTAISIAAVACGAEIIEKHFTLSRRLEGPDHKASLEPNELKLMVESIRSVEQALGDGNKRPCVEELDTLHVARRSLYANKKVSKGEKINAEDISVLRPASGLSPMNYWSVLESTTKNEVEQGGLIEL